MSRENSPNKLYSDYAFISIGANLSSSKGSPTQTIASAFESIASFSSCELIKSSIYSSSPVDSPPGTPDFLNALAGIIPLESEEPLSLLHKLQAIENEAGRTRSGIRNEARILDLDLILFKNVICESPELILPHPRACERRFVLQPLIEVTEKDFRLPGETETINELLQAIGNNQAIQKL